MIEKAGAFGGSTARSGGGIWAPGNTVLRDAGVPDTPGQARAYLAHVAGAGVPAPRQEAFLEHGPGMLDLVLGMTPLRLAWVPGYADYYPEAPGGLAGGRSVEPVPLDSQVLGGELAHLARPYVPSPVAITQAEYRWLSLGPRHPRAVIAGARVAVRTARGRVRGRGTSAMASCSRAAARSVNVPPALPASPGTAIEKTPRPATSLSQVVQAAGSAGPPGPPGSRRRTAASGPACLAQSRMDACRATWSGVMAIGTA